MARMFPVAPDVRPNDRTFFICADAAPACPRPGTPAGAGDAAGRGYAARPDPPWPPGIPLAAPAGTMADLAYAPHTLHTPHAAHSATATLPPPRAVRPRRC